MKQLLYSKVYPKDINFLSYIQGNQAILKFDKRMIITCTMSFWFDDYIFLELCVSCNVCGVSSGSSGDTEFPRYM